ncbi:MAG: hypothetical protein EBT56_15195 [Betaproteobacteria bacterium]|nr:hypothetical protein [Betaproteobacteria bacterium]
MRKFLAIFLLVLLPLQFSWAAVAGYCQHEAGVTANALTSDLKTPPAATAQGHQSDYHVNPTRAHTERPERPQWLRLA